MTENVLSSDWRLRPKSRTGVLEHEPWIDVAEWCEIHQMNMPFLFPAEMTHGLCDAIERIPFRMIGETTQAQRGAVVFERGASALERCLHRRPSGSPEASTTLTFAAPLPCSALDPTWRRFKLHCRPGNDGRFLLMLGLEHEL
jgi:hypothetical protein